jgi:hypothetical protein
VPSKSTNYSRVAYVIRTLESACWLAQGAADETQAKVIWERASVMLRQVWEFEVAQTFFVVKTEPASSLKETLLAVPEMKPQEVRERMGVFWDWVANHFIQDQSVIREFEAVYNETVNPNGEHNVSLRVIPARAVIAFHLFIPCP